MTLNKKTENTNNPEIASISAPPLPPAKPSSRSTAISGYDPLDAFLQEIKQYPLLDPDEEKMLAEDYVKTGDAKIAATLVTSNLRLVVKIAFEYRRAHRNIMDLIQEGNVGLMHAVKKFDPSKGVKLSSYAAWWIRAYMLRFILGNWRLVKLGTTQSQRKLFFNLNKERKRLVSLGIEPTPEVLAKNLQTKEKEIVDMEQRMLADDVSLNAEIGDSDGRTTTRQDMLPSKDDSPDKMLEDAMFFNKLKHKLNQFGMMLDGKEAVIFKQRLTGDSPKTLQEIGRDFNVSRERIRQIEKRLMVRLKAFLEEEMPGYFLDGLDL
jgi:RNA polymerase sigma-32 factor